jgi:hypothetical protein
MNIFNPNKAGMIGAAVGGICSLLWSLLVGVGVAHNLLNIMFKTRFIINPFQVTDFSWSGVLLSLVVSLVCGYVVFGLIAWLANLARQQ